MMATADDFFDQYADQPVYISGVGRSGTSYLLTLLNAAPDIHLSFEGRMLKEGVFHHRRLQPITDELTFYRLLDQLLQSESETNRNKPLLTVVRTQRESLYAFWQVDPSYGALMREIYRRAFERRLWGDKLLRIEYAWSLLEVWQRAKFIILLRDPRAVAASQKLKWAYNTTITSGYWNTHLNLSTRLKREFPDQVLLVRYEQLVTTPHETLAEIFAFIGIQMPDLADILSQHPPQTDGIKRWRTMLSDGEIRAVERNCYVGMQSVGYTHEFARAPGAFSRVSYVLNTIWWHRAYLLKPMLLLRKNALKRLWMMYNAAGSRRDSG